MNNIFYTYIYFDPSKTDKEYIIENQSFNMEPIYVGKGKNNRSIEHLRLNKKRYLYYKLNNLKSKSIIPIVLKIKENLLETEALELEKLLIKTIGRKDLNLGPLCNLTDGGEGTSNRIYSLETRNKISEKAKNRKITSETKEKMSISRKGKKFNKSHKENLAKTLIKRNKERALLIRKYHSDIKNTVYKDYKNGTSKTQLAKKYNIAVKTVSKLIKEESINNDC